MDLGDNPVLSPQEEIKRIIAATKPQTATAPVQGATQAAPSLIAPPTPPVTPVTVPQQRQTDTAELNRLKNTGAGVEQLQQKHPILGTIARVGDVALSSLFPRIAMNVPGTELHHQQLVNQAEGRVNQDLAGEKEEAQNAEQQAATAHTQAETAAIPAHTALEQAEADKAERTPASKPLIHETDQGIFLVDPDTRQATPLTFGGKPLMPKQTQKPDTPEQQFIDKETSSGKSLDQAIADYARVSQKPEQPQRPQQQLGVVNGKVVELRPGMDFPEGAQTLGGEIKTQQGNAGAKADIDFANNYIKGGHYDGPHDEALIEKFFDMSKPSSGFRMTQPQIDMALHARSALQGLKARATHLLSPDAPYLDDHQRAAIVQTMNDLQSARGGAGGGSTKDYGAAPAGKAEGSTGTLPDGTKVVVRGGRIVAQ